MHSVNVLEENTAQETPPVGRVFSRLLWHLGGWETNSPTRVIGGLLKPGSRGGCQPAFRCMRGCAVLHVRNLFERYNRSGWLVQDRSNDRF